MTMAAVLTAGWLMERLGHAIDAGEGKAIPRMRDAAPQSSISCRSWFPKRWDSGQAQPLGRICSMVLGRRNSPRRSRARSARWR